MEEKIYEARPFAYLLLAFYALAISRSSAVMVMSGFFLLVAGVWVWRLRHNYRLYYRERRPIRVRHPRTPQP